MIALEVTKEELSLLKMLLNREEVSTRIEIHHARMSFEYRDYLEGLPRQEASLFYQTQNSLAAPDYNNIVLRICSNS